MPFTVAIIGRPNVGKSTLFNRLVGKRLALVDDSPGVTRDRREGEGRISDLHFTVFDTAGLEDAAESSLEARMTAQTAAALEHADVALFLVDARAGLTPMDSHFAEWLRQRNTPVILVANKCEGGAGQSGMLEAYALGLGDPVPLSAEHGEGIGELYDALLPFETAMDLLEDNESDIEDGEDPEVIKDLQLAIVGRPNVGKSTLVNRLIGEDRMLTGPEAGITRDAIGIGWTFQGRQIRLIDTAGLRRKARITKRLEGLAAADTLRAVRYAHVVVMLVDAQAPLEKQDLTIARTVIEQGRVLILGVNKCDLLDNRATALNLVRDRLQTSLPQVKGIPVIPMSAATGRGIEKLLPESLRLFDAWNTRVPTAALNRWLADVIERHPPPLAQGRRVKIRYATQVKARPPTFVLFTNRPEELPASYLRYLANDLRAAFDLPGIPLRLHTRKGPQSLRGKGLDSREEVGRRQDLPEHADDPFRTRNDFRPFGIILLVEAKAFLPLSEEVAWTIRRRLFAGQGTDGSGRNRDAIRAGRPEARNPPTAGPRPRRDPCRDRPSGAAKCCGCSHPRSRRAGT